MSGAAPLLKDVFGFDGFRPGQEEIVEAVTAGENVLAIMPTGGGKSLCFQLPALMREGVTVVISPLIALMRDQVRSLQEVGVGAGALTSGNTPEETDAVWAGLEAGTLKLLYMAPERLAAGSVIGMLKRVGVRMIAVDEAHCVSQWGHDFRPDYLRIGELKRALGVPLAAFTATADAETQAEIVQKLFDGTPPRAFLRGFDRPNIHLAFAAKNSPRNQILNFAAARRGQSGIVYCGTRAKTEGIARALNEAGQTAIHYHGGMEAEDRRIAERRFQQEDGLIVAATVAFGMGIDKPDIRWVAHADLPKSIESYYQEIGRAGRDGAPAETLTLFGPEDIRLRRSQIDEGLAPPERRSADHARLNGLLGLAEALDCRRKTLLEYFGETDVTCGRCDLCDSPVETFDGTTAVRKALSAMLRTEEWFGAGHLIDILLGNETDKIKQRGHQSLPTYGVGTEYSKAEWQAVFRQMMGRDLAEAAKVPAYIIFTDRTLIEMAETRPVNLDQMARISGIGAKKLESYGAAFLEVINGEAEMMHPQRRKLAGRNAGSVYDQLLEVQAQLSRGALGTDKPLSCSASLLAKVAQMHNADASGIERILGDKRAERFGAAFLDVLRDAT